MTDGKTGLSRLAEQPVVKVSASPFGRGFPVPCGRSPFWLGSDRHHGLLGSQISSGVGECCVGIGRRKTLFGSRDDSSNNCRFGYGASGSVEDGVRAIA